MGMIKSALGFGGVERVGDRLLEAVSEARARGETQVWVTYTQHEIGVRANATQMGGLIRRKLEKAGFAVVEGHGGAYGEDVRLLVRCQ